MCLCQQISMRLVFERAHPIDVKMKQHLCTMTMAGVLNVSMFKRIPINNGWQILDINKSATARDFGNMVSLLFECSDVETNTARSNVFMIRDNIIEHISSVKRGVCVFRHANAGYGVHNNSSLTFISAFFSKLEFFYSG